MSPTPFIDVAISSPLETSHYKKEKEEELKFFERKQTYYQMLNIGIIRRRMGRVSEWRTIACFLWSRSSYCCESILRTSERKRHKEKLPINWELDLLLLTG